MTAYYDDPEAAKLCILSKITFCETRQKENHCITEGVGGGQTGLKKIKNGSKGSIQCSLGCLVLICIHNHVTEEHGLERPSSVNPACSATLCSIKKVSKGLC
ncbi:uncharacterized protein [Montipora capricornis]|uniref:uncharacterized protein n=1 Tax=Montipora capricornis TaxID=246305 RepID=UPI0035F20B0C